MKIYRYMINISITQLESLLEPKKIVIIIIVWLYKIMINII